MDHYERLGLAREADARDVAKAFRRAARDEHPDRGGDVERFRAIEEAYRVLVDPDLRRAYDRALDGTAHSWDDVEWGVDVAPTPRQAGTPSAAPDGEPDAEPGLDWDDDLGWGADDPAPGGAGEARRTRRLDPFVGGPVRLPDPLAPPAVDVPLAPATLLEWVAGLNGIVLAVGAVVVRELAVSAGVRPSATESTSDLTTWPVMALVWLAVAVFIHVKASGSSGGEGLAWVLTVVAIGSWFAGAGAVTSSGLVVVSIVAGLASVALAVLWARLRRGRMLDPERLAALNRLSVGWRVDRHHRAEEWNRVRAAVQVPGRVAVLVGPPATDVFGRLLPARRWTFDPRTGAQEVRVVGPASPQGSWVVVDTYGRVVATAPAWSPEAWLDALQEVTSTAAGTGART